MPDCGAPDEPLVLVETIRGARRIAALDRHARALGLRPGLTLAEARARLPRLVAADHDPPADAALLERLATACERWTPLVALDGPDGLALDVTGCAHLVAGEASLRTAVLARLRQSGLNLCATLAGTPDAARALARFGETEIVPPDGEAVAVGPLPVAALELPEETRNALRLAGLRRIADLASLPSRPLAARFGEVLPRRLNRLLGREDRRIVPRRPSPAFRAERAFAEPVTRQETLARALRSLAGEIEDKLAAAERGGRVFEATFFRSDGAVRRIEIATGRPSRDPETLLRLLHGRLDALADPLDPGFGFDLVRLSVLSCETLRPHQTRIGEEIPDEEALSDLLDRLAARFGDERVLRFSASDTHDPVRIARLVPAGSAPAGGPWPLLETGEPPLRPLRLFALPEPVEALAEVPDGPPLQFRWRGMLHRVVRVEGPERIAPEWWRKPNDATRDYYRAEDADGHRFWLFRAGLYGEEGSRPRWYLHGLFA